MSVESSPDQMLSTKFGVGGCMTSLLDQLDKFIQHHPKAARDVKQDLQSTHFLESIGAQLDDEKVSSETLILLCSSTGFRELVQTLLQNNSMPDIDRRRALYRSFLELLVLLASNQHTVGYFQEPLMRSSGLQVNTRSGTTTLTLLAALRRRSRLYLQLHPLKNRPQLHWLHPKQSLKLNAIHLANVVIAVENFVQQSVSGGGGAGKVNTSVKRSSDGDAKPQATLSSQSAASQVPNNTDVALEKLLLSLDELYKVKKTTWWSGSVLGYHPGGSGTGFGGSYGATNSLSAVPGVAKATQAEAKHDQAVQHCAEKLQKLLSENSAGTSAAATKSTGGVSSAALGILQKHVGFRRMCTHLLHNDSLMDICRRIPLYQALLQLLGAIAHEPHTAPFLVEPLVLEEKNYDKDTTCVDLLSALAHQARVYLQLQGVAAPVSAAAVAPAVAAVEEPVKQVERVATRSVTTSITTIAGAAAPTGVLPNVADESTEIANVIISTEVAVKNVLGISTTAGKVVDPVGRCTSAGPSSGASGSGAPTTGSSAMVTAEDPALALAALEASGGMLGSSFVNIAQHMFGYGTAASPSTTAVAAASSSSPSPSSVAGPTQSGQKAVVHQVDETEEVYVRAMTPLRFSAVDLVAQIAARTTKHHHYTAATTATAGTAPAQAAAASYQAAARASKTPAGISSNPKQRMTRIAKEMATLSTSLPVEYGSSIFLRVDETRMDLIKALIIGPLGTPYANGCFEFDILLPPDYPHRPPSVMLVTTGAGTVRFNPNLYNSGYVCLSLLGTWSGPGWDAQHSTLLQVLVSIQSLIMVPDPYYNEPGYEHMRNSAASKAYNRNIRYQCLRFAVYEQLRAPSGVFREVIRAHFLHKRASMLQQLENWRSEMDGGDTIIGNIHTELNKLV